MKKMKKMNKFPWLAGAALSVLLLSGSGGASGADEISLEGQLEAKAPAIVTVKYVWKAGNYEAHQEVRGVMVDGTGLVMLSGATMGGDGAPIDLKILFGNDAKEWTSVLVARDSLLDLAYVQILDTEGKTFDAVDLSKGGEMKVGQSLFGVTRGSRGFDFAPAIRRLYVSGKVEKPRPMWDFGGDFKEVGLPAFDAAGRPVAVLVSQQASEGAEDGGSEVFLLPLDAVGKSLAQAKKRIPDAIAKGKAAKPDKTEKPETSDEPPAMGDEPKPPEPATPEQPPK